MRGSQHALKDLDEPSARRPELCLDPDLPQDGGNLVLAQGPREELDGDEAARGEVLEEPGVGEGAAAEEADRPVGRGGRGRGRGRGCAIGRLPQGDGRRGRFLLGFPPLRHAQVLFESERRARAEVPHRNLKRRRAEGGFFRRMRTDAIRSKGKNDRGKISLF